jgi:hypothetical protein
MLTSLAIQRAFANSAITFNKIKTNTLLEKKSLNSQTLATTPTFRNEIKNQQPAGKNTRNHCGPFRKKANTRWDQNTRNTAKGNKNQHSLEKKNTRSHCDHLRL